MGNSIYDEYIKNVEKSTGLSISEIRKLSPYELREMLNEKHKTPFQIKTEFPFIGRGNVLRDKLTSSKKINKNIDKLLKIKQ